MISPALLALIIFFFNAELQICQAFNSPRISIPKSMAKFTKHLKTDIADMRIKSSENIENESAKERIAFTKTALSKTTSNTSAILSIPYSINVIGYTYAIMVNVIALLGSLSSFSMAYTMLPMLVGFRFDFEEVLWSAFTAFVLFSAESSYRANYAKQVKMT